MISNLIKRLSFLFLLLIQPDSVSWFCQCLSSFYIINVWLLSTLFSMSFTVFFSRIDFDSIIAIPYFFSILIAFLCHDCEALWLNSCCSKCAHEYMWESESDREQCISTIIHKWIVTTKNIANTKDNDDWWPHDRPRLLVSDKIIQSAVLEYSFGFSLIHLIKIILDRCNIYDYKMFARRRNNSFSAPIMRTQPGVWHTHTHRPAAYTDVPAGTSEAV